MAYHSDSNVATKPGMRDRTDSNIARDGAAKRPQTKFAVTHGMRDRTAEMSGVSPENPGAGPDGGAANPLAPSAKLKKFPQAPVHTGMKDQTGNGSAVLGEASRLGK